ncbi:flagellar filament capping protein FliD [Clostridium bovifaecis]|uniref:Flagellar hook-associated protein 2 n=1 Tax=Clostridium bovifaecis TaxID=2184719 RepID=A0A6I6ES54_9CLOT|nr:flagellar filament capping protein FliD [Clostridium bovifaecis]
MSSVTGNSLRITGMATGLDTDSMIKQLMQVEQIKVDRVNQQKQLLQWQQEAYRNIINGILDFKNKYFDVLSSNSIFSSTNFSASSVQNILGTSAVVTPGTDAKTGDYKVNVQQLASKAMYTGSANFNVATSSKSVYGIKIDDNNKNLKVGSETITIDTGRYNSLSELATNINTKLSDTKQAVVKNEKVYFVNKTNIVNNDSDLSVDNNEISVEYGGNIYKLQIDAGKYNPFELADKINSKIQSALADGSGNKFSVDNPNKKLVYNENNNSFEIQDQNGAKVGTNPVINYKLNGETVTDNQSYSGVFSDIGAVSIDYSVNTFSGNNSNPTTATTGSNILAYDEKIIKDFNDTFAVQVNGNEAVKITIAPVTIDPMDLENNALKNSINNALQANGLYDGAGSGDLFVDKIVDGKLVFKSTTGNQIRIKSDNDPASGSALSLLGVTENYELTQSTSQKMSDLINTSVSFKINNVDFNYDFSSNGADKDKTISEVLKDISSKANVDVQYSSLSKVFTMTSKKEGANEQITASDVSGSFIGTIFGEGDGTIAAGEVAGKDAIVKITEPGTAEQTVYKSSNSFTIDGVVYKLQSENAVGEYTTFTVSGDVDKAFDKIKTFIDDYNNLITGINAKLSEKKQYDYKPLTEAEKEEMSESQIEKWEGKAQEGLLRNDSVLQTMLSRLRSAFYDKVSQAGTNLWEVGLGTSSDISEKGVIKIDETKLKKALKDDPNKVMDLFVAKSDKDYVFGGKNADRYNEEGIFRRLDDIIQDYTSNSISPSGHRGILVEKAGVKGRITEFQNLLSEQIKQKSEMINKLTEQLITKENNYYTQFSKLETIMNQYNAQSSWLTQQLGQG